MQQIFLILLSFQLNYNKTTVLQSVLEEKTNQNYYNFESMSPILTFAAIIDL